MSEPVLQVKGLKTYYYTEEDWISRLSRAKRLPSSAKAAAASL